MDLAFPDELRPLRQMVGWLGETYLRPLGLVADKQGGPLPPDHPFFAEAVQKGMTGGFTGKLRAEPRVDDGRVRKRARRGVLLAEEAAYWDRGMATSLPGPGLGGAPVMLLGDEGQRERFLGPFVRMKRPMWSAFAMTEPGAGSDVARIRTRARQTDSGWVLDGAKCFISNGARAAWTVVWATVDPDAGRSAHRAFVVELGTPGFTVGHVEKKMGLAASETATLHLSECAIPADNLLAGSAEGGFRGAMATFNLTRPMVAAMAVGMGRAARDEALRFATEAFTGASAWRLDRARERVAWIDRKLEVARLMAWQAAWRADHRQDNAEQAAMAKFTAAEVGLRAASLGMDILGEAGGATDLLVEKLFRDVKALDIVEGTGQIQRLVVARRRLDTRRDT